MTPKFKLGQKVKIVKRSPTIEIADKLVGIVSTVVDMKLLPSKRYGKLWSYRLEGVSLSGKPGRFTAIPEWALAPVEDNDKEDKQLTKQELLKPVSWDTVGWKPKEKVTNGNS